MNQKIQVDRTVLGNLNTMLASKVKIADESDIIYQRTAYFDDNVEADIKLVNAEPPYVDAVLFQNGHEVCTLEPCAEEYDGEYVFQFDGKMYTVEVGVV